MCISALGLKGISNPFSHDIQIIGDNGKKKFFDPKFVLKLIDSACEDLSDPWKIEQLYSRVEASIYGGISESEIKKIVLECASFYAKYDREFETVNLKLKSKIGPIEKVHHKFSHLPFKGFASIV